MTHVNTTMNQILKHIPRHVFDSCVKAHQGDKKVRRFTTWNQLGAMLYGQLTQRKTLRDLWSSLISQAPRLYHLGMRPVHFSSMSRANEKRSASIYEALFNKLYQRVVKLPASHGFRFKNELYALDATIIDLCLSLYSWAPLRGKKAGVKVNTLLNLKGNLPECIVINPANHHEVNAAYTFEYPKDSIVIIDRGYEDFSLYACLDAQDVFFVTRMKRRRIYKTLERRKANKTKGVLADDTICFSGFTAQKECPITLRRVVYRDPETGKQFEYVTNNFNLSALTIAQIYKARWQVELFFKWIKQHLKIKSFYGRSENAVRSQIFIAMIAYLLIYYLKHLSRSSLSIMQVARLLQVNIMERCDLWRLLKMDFKLSKNEVDKKQLCFNNI